MTRWFVSETQERQPVHQQRKWHIEAQPITAPAVTYAIGDIHGSVSLLRQLLHLLPYRAEDTLIFLGDYLDRGEDSLATINTLRVACQIA